MLHFLDQLVANFVCLLFGAGQVFFCCCRKQLPVAAVYDAKPKVEFSDKNKTIRPG